MFPQKIVIGIAIGLASISGPRAQELPHPILFVTQVPVPADFTTIGALFGNHRGDVTSAARGGDLYIRYPDGTLKNLTRAAGYGKAGSQAGNGIAVRQPSVHWSGTRAVFSMVVGAPLRQYHYESYYWQLYEITGLGPSDTPVITKVPNQPADYNNISPIYGTDDRIIFSSDRPRNGERHLYPQLDEYEEAPTVTGLWSLDPVSGDLFMINHSPSGVFSPLIDSFGRVLFTRWDHLQRDQQADSDAADVAAGRAPNYGTFNYSDESADALKLLDDRSELFPEPRRAGGNLLGHTFSHFFPWQISEDGTEEETLNHVGRQELTRYVQNSFNDDPNLFAFYNYAARYNSNYLDNFLQIAEDPTRPGTYIGIDAPEFSTHSAGQILSIDGAPSVNADAMRITYLTPESTKGYVSSENEAPADHTGLYRNPLPLSDGRLAAVHTSARVADRNTGTRGQPGSLYDFRLKLLRKSGAYYEPDQALTPGIEAEVSYHDPDFLVTYSGPLWELDPVEVRPRERPARRQPHLPAPEREVFSKEGVDLAAFQAYLRTNDLALIVSRDVTTRDQGDKQQPFNLRVTGTETQTAGSSGKLYDVSHLQLFQADQIRGIRNGARAGRRVLAQPMHGTATTANPPAEAGPSGSVQLGADGSMAAFVPARRAVTWQLTAPNGEGVVRERYWLTFQPGEIRTCASCHGVNQRDQAGQSEPLNEPEALRVLLQHWKATTDYGDTVRITSARRNSHGKLTVQALFGNRQTLVLEHSTDLANWTPIQTNELSSDSTATWDMDAAPPNTAGFFRILAR